ADASPGGGGELEPLSIEPQHGLAAAVGELLADDASYSQAARCADPRQPYVVGEAVRRVRQTVIGKISLHFLDGSGKVGLVEEFMNVAEKLVIGCHAKVVDRQRPAQPRIGARIGGHSLQEIGIGERSQLERDVPA